MDTERADIERQIGALLKGINIELAYGDAATANQMRDRIGDLERRIGQINREKREKEK